MAERHQQIEGGGLTGVDESWGQQAGCSTGVEVEEMTANGDAEMLLAFVFEGSEGQVRQGKIGSRLIRFGEPALGRRGGSIGHGA
jgi:hypothetical protein